MPLVRFRPVHRDAVLRICAETYGAARLERFIWQPCQQIESLEKDCPKYVYTGRAVRGYGAAYRLDETHYRLNLIVDPARTRKGMGTALLDALEAEVMGSGGEYLQARTLAGVGAGVQFLHARGFERVHVMRGMSLAAADFRFEEWAGLGERLAADGFRVVSARDEDEAGEDPLAKLAELHGLAQQGWPSPDPTQTERRTREELLSMFTGVEFPGRISVMKRGREYVGYTSAKNPPTGTAVRPDCRGLGVATYLKAWDIKRCIDDGWDYFESATANPSMQRVNEKLGYKFNGLDEVRFLKRLGGRVR